VTAPTGPTGPITTVLWDFAGVCVSSPWAALADAGGGNLELLIGTYDEDTDHPWHRVERGELAILDWVTEITELGKAQGIEIDFSPLQSLLGDMEVHHEVVERIRALRAEGYRVGLVTNNVREGSAAWRAKIPVDDLFEVVIDSSEVGMRKPNPAIYHLALEQLGVTDPATAVFIDDALGNVEGARRAGLHALHFEETEATLLALDELLAR
jgi:epoxide hydrolase-like predicted phosphatase